MVHGCFYYHCEYEWHTLFEEDNEDGDGDNEDEPRDACSHPRVIADQGVRPVTWTQLDSGWWNCRPLTLTSSAVDKLIITSTLHIDTNPPICSHFEHICGCIGHQSLPPDSNAGDTPEDIPESTSNDTLSISSIDDALV